jgi:hypothetical protein
MKISNHDCGCGCEGKCNKAPILNESQHYDFPISENLRYHIDNRIPLNESVFRAAST